MFIFYTLYANQSSSDYMKIIKIYLIFLCVFAVSVVLINCKVDSKSEVEQLNDTILKRDTISELTTQKPEEKSPSAEVDTLEFESLEPVVRITEYVNNPKSVIISPDGRYAYINNLEGMNTMIIDANTFETLALIEHTGKPVEFGITQEGRYIWISYFRLLEPGYPKELGNERSYRYKSVVVVYDTLTENFAHRIEVGIIPKVIAVSPDEKLVLVANWNSNDISVISTATYEVIKTISVGAIPRGVKFTPDGKYAYVCNFGGSTISKINIDSLEVESTIKNVGYKPRDIVISSKGDYAYFSNFGDGYLRKLDLETDEVVDKLKISSEARSVCMSNNNRYVFVVCYQTADVYVIDTEIFEIVGKYKSDVGAVGVALTPDNKYLWVTNQKTGSIKVYKVIYK